MPSNANEHKSSVEREANLRKQEIELRERELKAREKELGLKKNESQRSRWSNPLVLALLAATVAGLGNLAVAWLNSLELQRIEAGKAEASRILEVIKVANAEISAENLKFLVEAGLISDPLKKQIANFLAERKPGQGPSSAAGATKCAELKSSSDFHPVSVTFTNKTDTKLKLFWIDQQCALTLYGDITIGGRFDQVTYVGHRWLATDSEYRPIGIYQVHMEDKDIQISAR